MIVRYIVIVQYVSIDIVIVANMTIMIVINCIVGGLICG